MSCFSRPVFTERTEEGGRCEVDYWNNSSVISRRAYFDADGDLHRADGLPALVLFYSSGNVFSMSFWDHGRMHNENGPARVQFTNEGRIMSTACYINGRPKISLTCPYSAEYDENGELFRVEYAYENNEFETVTV